MSMRAANIATAVMAVLLGLTAMYVLRPILLPFVLAGLLSILFKPLVTRLRSWRFPMWLSMIVVLIIASTAIWGVYSIMASGVTNAIAKAPDYQVRIAHLSDQTSEWIRDVSKVLYGRPTRIRLEEIIDVSTLVSTSSSWLGDVVSFVGDAVLVLLFLVFMIPAGEHFPKKLDLAMQNITWFNARHVYDRVFTDVLRYISMKTLLSALVSLATWGLLEAFGVDFAPLIALMTFFLNFLPNIGSIVATLIPTAVALLQFDSFGRVAGVVIALTVTQNVVGNLLEPRVMGRSLDLSPVVILFSLVFWGWMWGAAGMILSVPIMAVIKTILDASPTTKPLAILMAGRIRT